MALLVIAAIAGVVAIALLIGQLNTANIRLERDKITADALAKAKEALISYAAAYDLTHTDQVPGYLPCPDMEAPSTPDEEGQVALNCGVKNLSKLGKLPWKTLGMLPLRDGNNECLWYAVSGSFKYNTKTDMMNWDTLGQFDVVAEDGSTVLVGATPHSRAVAIIFAPGAALSSQDRSPLPNTPNCGGNYTASNYLDSDSGINNSAVVTAAADAISRFIARTPISTFNDKFIVITADDIFNAVRRRADFRGKLDSLTQKAAQCVAVYGLKNSSGPDDHRLPWATPVALPDFFNNASYDDNSTTTPLSGRFSDVVNDSKVTTGNTIDGNYLLTATNCNFSAADDAWYKNWKDHLFYAVADAFKPGPATPIPTLCGTCLKVNGADAYAAVVMFAGPRLVGQTRASDAEKSLISNYLEKNNRTNHPNAAGDSDYQSGAPSSSLNDELYCINPQLGVLPC